MGAVETVVDVATDNKKYYDCPKCGRECWAYGSFVGNVCTDCPGTFKSAVIKTTDLATLGATSTIVDAITDTKTEYRCPRCGVKKWAYGVGIGRPCFDCIENNGILDVAIGSKEKKWFDMDEASEYYVSLKSLLDNYYNDDGTTININGCTFNNVISKEKLSKVRNGYTYVKTNWRCGNNAINICLKIHGYSKQLSENEYKYNTILKCGWSYENFYTKNIKNNFKYCGWTGNETLLGGDLFDRTKLAIKWNYINNTNFNNYSLIINGGRSTCGHYTIIIGVDTKEKYYLITDQSLTIWLVDESLLRQISVYEMTKSMGVNLYKQHSIYKVG